MAQYMAIMNEPSLLEKGIPVLADYARNHPKYYIRLTAYRGLLFFSENPDVAALIKSIEENEKDEKLRKLYQSNVY
jgi:aminopeptidase N